MTKTSAKHQDQVARETAAALLDIGAVQFWSEQPFMFTSGLASPVYIDCRKVMSHPGVRERLMGYACEILSNRIGLNQFDALAGGETAGIPYAAWMAAELRLPMQYVRKKPKGFARNAQVEGDFKPGQRVVLIEDLTTDGASKVSFAQALRRSGLRVDHTVMLFFYDIFPETMRLLAEHELQLHALATWRDVLGVAQERGCFEDAVLAEIEHFLDAPLKWSSDHGGASVLSI